MGIRRMRKLFASLVFLSAIGVLPAAAAADEIEGVIATITKDGVLKLQNGTSILLPDDFNVEGLVPGTHVYVDYEVIDDEKVALDVEIVD